MDLAAVMDEISAKLFAALPDVNPFPYPARSVTPTSHIISYPERIDYGTSYQNGQSRFEALPVFIVFGKVTELESRNAAAAFVKGSGASSVRQILEAGPYTNLWTLKVTDCEFSTMTEAGNTYLAAEFHCDITGPGS